jgi:hypothetical protein
MEAAPVKRYAATEYCAFCHYAIFVACGVSFGFGRTPIRNRNVLSLTPTTTVLQHGQPCASSATSRSHDRDVSVNLVDGIHATIAFGKELSDQAHCYHPYCLEFVTSAGRMEGGPSPAQLLSFAQSSKHMYHIPTGPRSKQATSSVMSSAHEKIRLPYLFEQIQGLSPELFKMVIEYAEGSPASSLLNIIFMGTLDLLLRTVPDRLLSMRQDIPCTMAQHMIFHFITIDGCQSWCGCEGAEGLVGYKGTTMIKADISQISNVLEFTIGRFGIQRLHFRTNKENSDFIGGRKQSCWTGEISSSQPFRRLILGLDVRYAHNRACAYIDVTKGS